MWAGGQIFESAKELMTATPAQIAEIFVANPVSRLRGGKVWNVESVHRDVAMVHHLSSSAFACSLSGATEYNGGGFCAHIMFVRSGELSVDQSGHHRNISAGDIFVAYAWQPMALEGSDDLDMLIIALPVWWAMQRFLDGFQVLPDLYVSKHYFAAPIIAELAQLIFTMNDDDGTSFSQSLTMIADLMRTALAACVDANKTMPRWQGRMGEILEFIVRNLETPGLSAQDAATSLKCSVRTIYKTCATYNTSFNAFLTEIRLVTAQYRLMRTNERVSEIAYDVGFSTLSHFSRLFRARFGMPAKTMRSIGPVAPREDG